MSYDHTQRGPLGKLMFAVALLLAIGAGFTWGKPAAVLLLALGVAVFIGGTLVGNLNVRDEVDRLSLRFGPVPLFRWTVPYERIVAVEPARSRIIDGWGMHWVPRRGWTINLWGFDCVELHLAGGRRMRIGTDDQAALVEFLTSKLPEQAA